jgi:hypothetical protein
MKIIQQYLDFTKEIIANDNSNSKETVYNYLLKWIAYIRRKIGKKTETTIILKGMQGAGKNFWTNVLAELFAGFSCGNVTDIHELTGRFNSIVEGKVFIVLNELKNAGEERTANFDALKSIITDPTIRINEKNQPRRDAENVANFVMITNHSFPVKIESGDRRYLVLQVNPQYKGDLEYFEKFAETLTPEFYQHFAKFLDDIDLTDFNPRKIPHTQEKEDIIKASLPLIDEFCLKYIGMLKDGMYCHEAVSNRPRGYKSDRSFQLALKDKCDRVRESTGERLYQYKLKPKWFEVFEKMRCDEEENNEYDVF